MEHIGISRRFFRHELNNYSCWEKAFWRELVQNSVDENCSRITVEIGQDDSGNTKISFSDNGPGMSETTMREIYFQLGETGKEGADTIGGHGRARILTCFAHESYSIRTQNLFCRGEGGNFTIDNSLPKLKGCLVEVVIDRSLSEPEGMKSSLEEYLSNCQLGCEVFINGGRFQDWLFKRKSTRQLSFGSVHVTKRRPRRVIARVRGVAMFEKWADSSLGAILEISPQESREILTVSRDNLKYRQMSELERFLAEISVDSRSLSRDCSVNRTEIYGAFRKVGERQKPESETLNGVGGGDDPARATLADGSESSTLWHDGVTPSHGTRPEMVAGLVRGEAGGGIMSGAAYTTGGRDMSGRLPDLSYSIHYEDVPKKLARKAKMFHRENIDGRRLKLLLAWDEAVNFFLVKLGTLFPGFQDVQYLPGFVFNPTAGGMHKRQDAGGGDDGHIICINPLDGEGRIAVSHNDYHKLFSIAAHEVAHVAESVHNETYAGVLTSLIECAVKELPALKSGIRACLKNSSHLSGRYT